MSPVRILLVEDNPADRELTVENIQRMKLHTELTVARDGIEALEHLKTAAHLPDLVLLDLNMPRMDGRQLLQHLKEHEDWRIIPVVVLTSSAEEADILASYKLHANCYVQKPVDLDGFRRIVEQIEAFWFTIVRLPPEKR